MMRTEKQILEARAGLMYQLEDLNKQIGERAATAEEVAKFDKIDADIEALTQELERNRKVAERKALMADNDGERAPKPEETQQTSVDYREVFDKWVRRGMGSLSDAEKQVMMKRGTNPQGVGTDNLGGYAVPQEFGDELIKSMAVYGGVLEDATVMRTQSGADMPFPTLDDTSVKGSLIAENASIAVNDLTFGTKTLGSYVYSSGIVLLSMQLLQDNGVDLESELTPIFAERLGRIGNEHLTTGDGSSKPTGFLTSAASGVTAAATAAVTRDEIVDLIHSVDRAYRPNAKFHLNDTTLAAIRKLSLGSGDARPLWQPSIRVGEPDTLEGFAYTVNNDMPDLGAENTPIAFGDFSKIRVRIVNDMGLIQFDEKYMNALQKGYMAWLRMDGALLDTSAIKKLTNAAS
jgi:HK97 family phage major capsid protein